MFLDNRSAVYLESGFITNSWENRNFISELCAFQKINPKKFYIHQFIYFYHIFYVKLLAFNGSYITLFVSVIYMSDGLKNKMTM